MCARACTHTHTTHTYTHIGLSIGCKSTGGTQTKADHAGLVTDGETLGFYSEYNKKSWNYLKQRDDMTPGRKCLCLACHGMWQLLCQILGVVRFPVRR